MAHGPIVEVGDQLADGAVEFGQREERPVSQPRQHPTLHYLDSNFDFGLVARPPHPGWQHGCAIMAGHVLVGPANPRLIATCGGDACLEIVADDLPRDTAEAVERADVTADPARQR